MLLILSPAVHVHGRYIQPRGNIFWFHLRVPSDLLSRFGKRFIRQSLKTSDKREAIRKADALYKIYAAQFKALRGDTSLTAADTLRAAQALADEWGNVELFIDHVAEPKLRAHIKTSGLPEETESYDLVEDREYLSPVEEKALHILRRGVNARRLSHAFETYKDTHQKSHDQDFMSGVQRDWDGLIAIIGDIPVEDLSREHGRTYISSRLGSVKTTTIRRNLSHINAVLNVAWREWELSKAYPFASLKIPSEGSDTNKRPVPESAQVKEMIQRFKGDTRSTALLILLQASTGARIGELSGLAVADVVLKHETPHLVIREQPWRSLKTEASKRLVPLAGLALQAATTALEKADTAQGLFPEYAKPRGADSASAAVNKRLKEWGITSHGFRHWIKDAFREISCPEDIRDAIQGHATQNYIQIGLECFVLGEERAHGQGF